jgi:RNA polymerase sigma-70 factor (ECF subfamily)
MEVGIPNRQLLSDEEARFADIYGRYGKHIHGYCARRTDGADVADAVAETFLVAWRRIEQIPGGDATLPWLYGVAYRVLSHQWRHKARGRKLIEKLSGQANLESPGADMLVVGGEKYRLVIKASSRLRPIDQEVLRLTLWEELSHAHAAAVLGIDAAAVKQRAYRARRNLATEYQKLSNERKPPAAQKGGGS